MTTIDMSVLCGVVAAVAFAVSVIVQLTKELLPIPTKLWVIIISFIVTMCTYAAAVSFGYAKLHLGLIILSVLGSFIVAYVAMYGFDTTKELWERLKNGGNINDNNRKKL